MSQRRNTKDERDSIARRETGEKHVHWPLTDRTYRITHVTEKYILRLCVARTWIATYK